MKREEGKHVVKEIGTRSRRRFSRNEGREHLFSNRMGVGLLIVLFMMAGCASTISREVRSQAEASGDLPLRQVLGSPERYEGKVVIWSGTVLEAKNTPEGTLLKVLQKPADYQDKPKVTDVSEGRFLALERRYLDPAIYSKGRAVTVAGKIVGKQALPQGDVEYVYPLLEVKDLQLWPETTPDTYYVYPHYYGYPFFYSRWGWRHGWW
jgi:outer membrane lipoprotein